MTRGIWTKLKQRNQYGSSVHRQRYLFLLIFVLMTSLLLSSEFVCVTVKEIDYTWQQV